MLSSRTKIVCTINPFRCTEEQLIRFIDAGMNVARLNFSHMTPQDGRPILQLLKKVRQEKNIPLSIMLDTKGPEVRLYGYNENRSLQEGDYIQIESHEQAGFAPLESSCETHFFTNLPHIDQITTLQAKVLLMDGFIEGKIVAQTPNTINVEILNSGTLRPKAHLSLPKLAYPLPFLSAKDEADIRFAVQEDLDYIALSFVQNAENLRQVRAIIHEEKAHAQIGLIAKIENKTAVENLDAIIQESDGIMVARGDLGVELDIEEVPVIQKEIIARCYLGGKPVITATQMLESMTESRVPTRAEVSDVANACFDFTSAVMLSGETAIGHYPELVIQTMKKILVQAEAALNYEQRFFQPLREVDFSALTSIIAHSAVATAYHSRAKAIFAFTTSGYSARMISKLRPSLPIYAFTPNKTVYQQLALNWGVLPVWVPAEDRFETMLRYAMERAKQQKMVQTNDRIVIVAGLPMGISGKTNMVRVEIIP